MFSLYVIGLRNKANICYTILNFHEGDFRNNKSSPCFIVLNIKEPIMNRFLTVHPELRVGCVTAI